MFIVAFQLLTNVFHRCMATHLSGNLLYSSVDHDSLKYVCYKTCCNLCCLQLFVCQIVLSLEQELNTRITTLFLKLGLLAIS